MRHGGNPTTVVWPKPRLDWHAPGAGRLHPEMTAPGNVDVPVQIRDATYDDVSAVARIESATFADPWSALSFRNVIRSRHSRLAVATQNQRVVGYSVTVYVVDESELANLAVIPEVRGLGVGRLLLADALAEGWRRGARHMYLEVRESNLVARHLYEGAGFRESGRRRRYYSAPVEDAIIMVKEHDSQRDT